MSETEAKSICVHKLEDLLLEPMFTIFHVQHAQIASKTETQNSLIYHLKCSMAKVRGWNSTTVRDFCSNLMTRFPSLNESFLTLFGELQHLTCRILNQSSEASTYVPLKEEVHTYLHSLISACSDAFISHTHWFAVEESSTEYQSCKNNAKVRMQQANVVENTVMNFVKAGPKNTVMNFAPIHEESPSVGSLSVDGDQDGGDQDGDEHRDQDGDQDMDDFGTEEDNESDFTDDSNDSRTLGKKSIDLVSGAVQEGDVDGPQFSTPFADDKKEKKKKKKDSDSENFDSDSDSDAYDSCTTSSSDDSSGSSDSSESSESSESSATSASSSDPSDTSSDDSVSSFDTDFDCGSSSSDTGSGSESSDTGSEGGSEDSISVGEISSDESSEEEQPLEMLTRILSLKRKEDRYRAKKKRKKKKI